MQLSRNRTKQAGALGALAFVVLVFSIALVSATIDMNGDGSVPATAMAPESAPRAAAAGGQFERSYDTLRALTKAATTIVIGDVKRTESKVHEGVAFTISSIRVRENLKGDTERKTIEVFETGGPLPPHAAKGAPVAGATPETRELWFEGVPPMKVGEQYLLFLTGPHNGVIASGVYTAINEVQGKLFVDAKDVVGFKGDSSRLTDALFGVHRETIGHPLSRVVAQIRSMLQE